MVHKYYCNIILKYCTKTKKIRKTESKLKHNIAQIPKPYLKHFCIRVKGKTIFTLLSFQGKMCCCLYLLMYLIRYFIILQKQTKNSTLCICYIHTNIKCTKFKKFKTSTSFSFILHLYIIFSEQTFSIA